VQEEDCGVRGLGRGKVDVIVGEAAGGFELGLWVGIHCFVMLWWSV
jgi:hypothetical protein